MLSVLLLFLSCGQRSAERRVWTRPEIRAYSQRTSITSLSDRDDLEASLFLVGTSNRETTSISCFSTASGDSIWSTQLATPKAGVALQRIADCNGDGRDDVLLGSYELEYDPEVGGRALIIDGLSGEKIRQLASGDPADRLGFSLCHLNANGNPVSGIAIVSAIQSASLDAQYAANRTYEFGPSGVSAVKEADPLLHRGPGYVLALNVGTGEVIWRTDGVKQGDLFGYCVTALPDLDNDGTEDVAVASPRFDGAYPDSGRVAILSGSSGLTIAELFPPSSAGAGKQWGMQRGSTGRRFGVSLSNGLPTGLPGEYWLAIASGHGDVFLAHASASGHSLSAVADSLPGATIPSLSIAAPNHPVGHGPSTKILVAWSVDKLRFQHSTPDNRAEVISMPAQSQVLQIPSIRGEKIQSGGILLCPSGRNIRAILAGPDGLGSFELLANQ